MNKNIAEVSGKTTNNLQERNFTGYVLHDKILV